MLETLHTKRLIIRPWYQEDLTDFHAYAQSQLVGPLAGWKPHDSIETSFNILNFFINKEEVWAIEEKERHCVIGSIGFHDDKMRFVADVKMIGYALGEDYWGNGYMTEAVAAVLNYGFCKMNLSLISAKHFPHNTASGRVLVKNGFHFEGRLRRSSSLYDGRILDLMCYSITKEECLIQGGY